MALALLFASALAGCSSGEKLHPVAGESAKRPVDPWILSWVDPSVKTPALLCNGLIGIRIGRDGTGMDNGFFAIEEYDPQGEEKIRPLANPLAGQWTAGEHATPLDPAQGRGYMQSLDMRTGTLMTGWNQEVDGSHVSVATWMVMDPSMSRFADRWEIKADRDLPLHFHRTQGGGHRISQRFSTSSVFDSPPGVGESNTFGDSAEVSHRLQAGKAFHIERVIRETPFNSEQVSWDEIATSSTKKWTERWKTDIEIDGPVEDQQAVHSFLFYLRSAISPLSKMAVSPFGLSDATYFGHVFWDADIWVFPALCLIDPPAAKAISDYRVARIKAAEDNYNAWLNAGRPTGGEPIGRIEDLQGNPSHGAMFPWESSVSGKETVPGPSKWEHHITGDVAFSLGQARALGLVQESAFQRVVNETDEFWSARRELNSNQQFEIKGTMSPDESHTGDNDLYTNLLAQWAKNGGKWVADATRSDRRDYKLPHDDKSFLTYDGDTVKSYKQAAAVLAIYPLEYPPAEKQAKAMMDRFADKVIKNGPAMTDSVHSIVWSRLGEKDKAYEAWRNSWQPFTAHPLMLFSEKRSKDTAYFTTGAAGSLQSVVYGFLGFRLDWRKQDGAAWSLPLNGGYWLSVKPHLPPAWKSVKFKNFSVLGRRYTLTATQNTVHVTQGD